MSIEDIRRKHEAWKRLYGKGWSTSGLSVADADRLFAALDAEKKRSDEEFEKVQNAIIWAGRQRIADLSERCYQDLLRILTGEG